MNEETHKETEETSKLPERLRTQRPLFEKMSRKINAEFHGERY